MSCRLQVSTDLVLIDVAACLGKYILLDTLFILPFLLSPRKHIVRVHKLSSVSNTPFVNKPLSPDPQTKLYSIHSDVPSGSALPFP